MPIDADIRSDFRATGGAPDYPFGDTDAARQLSEGLRRLQETGRSLREIARGLGYKQAVVLSHMASGRVPIPLDRAADLAKAAQLPARSFIEACLRQRHPEVAQALLNNGLERFEQELALLASSPLDELSTEHKRILREVVSDANPARRWLQLPELPLVELIRRKRPNLATNGLDPADRRAISDTLDTARAG